AANLPAAREAALAWVSAGAGRGANAYNAATNQIFSYSATMDLVTRTIKGVETRTDAATGRSGSGYTTTEADQGLALANALGSAMAANLPAAREAALAWVSAGAGRGANAYNATTNQSFSYSATLDLVSRTVRGVETRTDAATGLTGSGYTTADADEGLAHAS